MRLKDMRKEDLITLVLYLDKKNKETFFQRLRKMVSGPDGNDWWLPSPANMGTDDDRWIVVKTEKS